MFGFMRLRGLARQMDEANFPQNRTVLAGAFAKWQARAAILPLSALAVMHAQAFTWPEPPEKSKPTRAERVQLYPNRATGLSQPGIDFQNSHTEQVAKSRRNARAHLDAMRVELAWLADPSLFAHPPGIKAITSEDKPFVEVRGVVSSHALRQRALELAKRYSESPIRDKLMVLIGPPIPRQSVATAELQTKSERFLNERLLEFSQDLKIEEVYPSGTVRIGGRVLSYEDKVAVSRSLRRLTGCMAVDNRIEVSTMSQDGELVTVITSDGETTLPGKLDEKRNGPVAMTRSDRKPVPGSLPGEEARLEEDATPTLSAPTNSVRTESRPEVAPLAPQRLPARAERPAERLVPVAQNTAVPKPKYDADERNPLMKTLEFPQASAKQNLPVAKPSAPAPASTTGIAVIEEAPAAGSGETQGVQAVVGWGSNPPAAQFNPDGSPVAPPAALAQGGPLFPNRPRLFFQPSVTPPASQRPAPPAPPRSAVRFMPSANGTMPPQDYLDPQPGTPAAAPVNGAVQPPAKPRRTGFLHGLGQPTTPKPQPYLSPIDVVQSGRSGSVPARPQPYANPSGANAFAQPMTSGGVNRSLGGQPYQLPGAVRVTPRPEGQTGAGPEASSAAQGMYPWDQPVLTDRTPRPSIETSPRAAARPERPPQPAIAPGTYGAPPIADQNDPNSTGERGYAGSPAPQSRPIASTQESFASNRSAAPQAMGSSGVSNGPTLGSVTIDQEPSPLPPGLSGAPVSRLPGGVRERLEADRPSASAPNSPSLNFPSGSLSAPSTGTAVVEGEGSAVPSFVPARRRTAPMEDQKTQEKNNRLLQTSPALVPPIATSLPRPHAGPAPEEPLAAQPGAGTGSMTLGTFEMEKDSLTRSLPSPQALTDLGKKTCGALISDIKTRKDGNTLCVEIAVRDASSEEEVLKRLCNLAAFSHPAIRIEVTRGQ